MTTQMNQKEIMLSEKGKQKGQTLYDVTYGISNRNSHKQSVK